MSNEGTSTSPGSDREEAHCSQVSNPVSSIDRNMLRRCAPRSPPFHPRMCAPWRHRQIGGPVGDLASSTENRHRTLHISLVKPFEEHAGFERVISRVQTPGPPPCRVVRRCCFSRASISIAFPRSGLRHGDSPLRTRDFHETAVMAGGTSTTWTGPGSKTYNAGAAPPRREAS